MKVAVRRTVGCRHCVVIAPTLRHLERSTIPSTVDRRTQVSPGAGADGPAVASPSQSEHRRSSPVAHVRDEDAVFSISPDPPSIAVMRNRHADTLLKRLVENAVVRTHQAC